MVWMDAIFNEMIKGFWHICMINDYYEIITEQLQLMKDSGLYDKCESIHVGCIGPKKEFINIKKLKDKNTKLIVSYDKDLHKYEFFTLDILYKTSLTEDFHGFYIHTKGCSWPGHEGGKHWRDYMNYYNITKWELCEKTLNNDCDTCGVKLLDDKTPPAYQLHYSGNFFWFKSDYIRTLKPVENLNWVNRYEAEMWPCSGNIQAASLCQKFIDYNTKGIFKP